MRETENIERRTVRKYVRGIGNIEQHTVNNGVSMTGNIIYCIHVEELDELAHRVWENVESVRSF
jgi:hypothetical protein